MAAEVRLLGRPEIELDGLPVPPDSPRVLALLAHLALHRAEPRRREQVAHTLWPDSTGRQALTNLRHLLHTLKAAVPHVERHLEITATSLAWRGSCRVDVAEFERGLAEGGEALADAVALHRGDLMEGFDDEWLLADRDRLRRLLGDALALLATHLAGSGRADEAVTVAERLRQREPLREETHRLLMRLYAERGDRARALAVYHEASAVLDRELGVAPSAETRAGYAALLPRAPTAPDASDRVPLVGRGPERGRLAAAWRAAEAGRSAHVVVEGEPGVGKTRLVEELRAWCARRGAAVGEARCFASGAGLPYEPLVQLLRSPGLAARVAALDRRRRAELARLLPELAGDEPQPVADGERRRRLLDALGAVVTGAGAPILLVVDDVHHADAETRALLAHLCAAHPAARLLIVATARAGETEHRGTTIDLAALDRSETAVLAERLGGGPLPAPDAARLYAVSGGNPLFVVESARAGGTLTPRVQAVVAARLDALPGPARALLDTVALVGREVDVDVLAAASGVAEPELVDGLDELWRRRILRERGPATYDVTHQTLREVATEGLAPARRRLLHGRIAGALESVHAPDPGPVSAQIAGHHARAGAARAAATWYLRAAGAAQLRQPGRHGVALLEEALAQLTVRPDGALEARVHEAMLGPLATVHGYRSPELAACQERVARLGAEPTAALLRSQAMSAAAGGDFATSLAIGRRLLAAGERDGDAVRTVEGAFVAGIAAFWLADLPAARTHLELAVDRYRPADHRVHLVDFGNDPKVSCLARLGNTLLLLGDADGGRAARAAAIAWADALGHPYSGGIARLFGALLALDADDAAMLRADVEALSGVEDSAQLELSGAALRGHIAVLDGDRRAVAAVRAAVERSRGEEAPGLPGILHRILLAACLAAGDEPGARSAATALLDGAPGGRVWAAQARAALDSDRGRAPTAAG